MLKDLYSKLEGTTVSRGTQNIAAAIQREVKDFVVSDEVALIAAIAMTAEIHILLSPIRELRKVSREVAEMHEQVTTAFAVALQVVGVSHGLTPEQIHRVFEVAERERVTDLKTTSAELDALTVPQTSLQ